MLPRRLPSFLALLLNLSLAGLPAAASERSVPFSKVLWEEQAELFREILEHPFLKELAEGSLSRRRFAFYLAQDDHYLREFARALNLTAARSPREEWSALLTDHALQALRTEKQLHRSVLGDPPWPEPSPEAVAYMDFLVATAVRGSFAESVAALLPCYWVYWEVGKALKVKASPDPLYQRWIETYSSPEYEKTVGEILALFDELARQAGPEERERMRRNFGRSFRYEWMFWDSAYQLRGWPPEAKQGEKP